MINSPGWRLAGNVVPGGYLGWVFASMPLSSALGDVSANLIPVTYALDTLLGPCLMIGIVAGIVINFLPEAARRAMTSIFVGAAVGNMVGLLGTMYGPGMQYSATECFVAVAGGLAVGSVLGFLLRPTGDPAHPNPMLEPFRTIFTWFTCILAGVTLVGGVSGWICGIKWVDSSAWFLASIVFSAEPFVAGRSKLTDPVFSIRQPQVVASATWRVDSLEV